MNGRPVAIDRSGLVCSVGLNAPAACAAIRCAIDAFQETRFIDAAGEWIMGASVPLEKPWRGAHKLSRMLFMAVSECLEGTDRWPAGALPLLLCTAEQERAGRSAGTDDRLFEELQGALGRPFHAAHSAILPQGRAAIAIALARAQELIHDAGHPAVLIAAADSLLDKEYLSAVEAAGRLLTSRNSDGFIAGEGAGALLVRPPGGSVMPELVCTGVGLARETASVESGEPLRADGLVRAIGQALAAAGRDMSDMDFRITDNSGEQYYFKEASLALSRTLRKRKEHFRIWHPAECVGEVGAAIGPVLLAVALGASRKGYAEGRNVLVHVGNDAGMRGALVLRSGG